MAARAVIDAVLAALLLVLLAPLMLVIAFAVRMDSPGPILFRQRRLGLGGRSFTLLKFRTMADGCDPGIHHEYVADLIAGRERVQDGVYKLARDPRITRVGTMLRRLSLDELPQLVNVVRGQMALVGPRPVIPFEAERYPEAWNERFAVRPGVTGLWQVSGRNRMTYREMIELDLQYVRARGLLLDLRILARTAWVVLRPGSAA